MSEIKIHLCPSPELYPYYHLDGATILIVDIFRATTTMLTAFYNGARRIYPVASTKEAETLGKELNALIAAERNVQPCSFAQLGNDPLEYRQDLVQGRDIIMTTTNGTKAIHLALKGGAEDVLIASFLNIKSFLPYCREHNVQDLIVLASGWQGQCSTEDMLYAGALVSLFEDVDYSIQMNDGAKLMFDLWQSKCLSLEERMIYLSSSEHYRRLVDKGFASAVRYCLTIPSESYPLLRVFNQELCMIEKL